VKLYQYLLNSTLPEPQNRYGHIVGGTNFLVLTETEVKKEAVKVLVYAPLDSSALQGVLIT
jgi:hypothetical protein